MTTITKEEFDKLKKEIKEKNKDIINFKKYHNCKESKGKIIVIEKDYLGNLRCPYCNKIIKNIK